MPTRPMTRCTHCRRLHPGKGRCPTCEQHHQQQRNHTRADRYDTEHRALRRAWAPTVATGQVRCARADTDPRCPGLIAPTDRWALDHLDDGTRAPSHGPCNERAIHHPERDRTP